MSNALTAVTGAALPDAMSTPAAARWALASLSLSMLMPALATSIANAGLPELVSAFGASFQQVQWIVLTYLLAVTTSIVGAGRLGDVAGRRRLLLSGMVLFTVASLACGLASGLWMLLAARAAQGVGAAIMMALTMAFVADTVPRARVGSAMGLLGTMSAIGTTLGPALGGFLMAAFGWQAIFMVNVPVGVVSLLLARRYLPADSANSVGARRDPDFRGTLLLAVTLGGYALAMTGEGGGHLGPRSIVTLIAAGCGAVLFVLVELKAPAPLVDMTMFRDGRLGEGLALNAIVSTVMMATLVVGPFYLSGALALGPAAVGLALSAGPLVAALAGVPAGRLVDRFGPDGTSIGGLAGIGVGAALLASIPTGGLVGYIAPVVLMTGSYAVFQAANNTAIMTGAGAERRGVVGGMLTLSRNLGLITGASVMATIFALASAAANVGAAHPEALARGMRVTFGVAAFLVGASLVAAAGFRAVARRTASVRPSISRGTGSRAR